MAGLASQGACQDVYCANLAYAASQLAKAVFAALYRLGYDRWIGCEYRPLARTEAGLGWLRPYLKPA